MPLTDTVPEPVEAGRKRGNACKDEASDSSEEPDDPQLGDCAVESCRALFCVCGDGLRLE